VAFDSKKNAAQMLYIQLQYNIIVRTDNRTYPRYVKLEFVFHRAKYQSQPRQINPAKVELQAQVIELRLRGWSYPEIARHLDISVGTAWNMTKKET
jgi:DNA-binding NarL/FixJ family response regulator